MCRFMLYCGPETTLDVMVTRPANSLINQSFKAKEREEPLNGDGFGIAWYVPELSTTPAVFRSISPAWNNQNLMDLTRLTRSSCILAHVRAASPGLPVTETNCHPFRHGPFAFMHNGGLAGFRQLKRTIGMRLSEQAYNVIQGTTDSEYIFAYFLDRFREEEDHDRLHSMARALKRTIKELVELTWEAGVDGASYLNLAIADGSLAVASRFCSNPKATPHTLYYIHGHHYLLDGDQSRMEKCSPKEQCVIISSEPLSSRDRWNPVPPNHLVMIDQNYNVRLDSCKVEGGPDIPVERVKAQEATVLADGCAPAPELAKNVS